MVAECRSRGGGGGGGGEDGEGEGGGSQYGDRVRDMVKVGITRDREHPCKTEKVISSN